MGLGSGLGSGLGCDPRLRERAPAYVSPISPQYLPNISPISPLYLLRLRERAPAAAARLERAREVGAVERHDIVAVVHEDEGGGQRPRPARATDAPHERHW